MTERRSTDPARRLIALAALLLATLALLFAGPTAVTAASVSTDCAGAGGGAAFVADSNFTVYYNDSQPMPDSGVFLNDSAMHFRNVTLVANGTASLRLENGTGTATCYADVNATATPVTIAPADGGATVVVDGAVDALSVGPAAVDTGNATLAYNASSAWNVSIAVSESDGTDLEAEDAATGSTLADGTVKNGTLALALPAGSHDVVLTSPPPDGDGGGSGPGPSLETVTPTPTEAGGGGGSGDDTETATATPRPTATEVPGASPTSAPTETAESSPGSPDEPPGGDGGGLPVGPVALAVLATVAVGAGLAWRRIA